MFPEPGPTTSSLRVFALIGATSRQTFVATKPTPRMATVRGGRVNAVVAQKGPYLQELGPARFQVGKQAHLLQRVVGHDVRFVDQDHHALAAAIELDQVLLQLPNDDHPLLRKGLAELINQEPDLIVCGEAESAAQARQAAGVSHALRHIDRSRRRWIARCRSTRDPGQRCLPAKCRSDAGADPVRAPSLPEGKWSVRGLRGLAGGPE